jgi:hypothetical protein
MIRSGIKNNSMKQIFTTLCIIYLIPAISKAQFDVGQKVIGGNLSFTSNTSENISTGRTKNTGWNFNFSKAKFYKPNVLRGTGITYGYSKNSQKYTAVNNFDNDYYSHAVGINIFSQRFIPLGKQFFFTLQTGGTAFYNSGKHTTTSDNTSSKTDGFSIGFGLAPGVSYRISERFLFDAFLSNFLAVSYAYQSTKSNSLQPQQTSKFHNHNFNLSSTFSNNPGSSVGFGFRYLLKTR